MNSKSWYVTGFCKHGEVSGVPLSPTLEAPTLSRPRIRSEKFYKCHRRAFVARFSARGRATTEFDGGGDGGERLLALSTAKERLE